MIRDNQSVPDILKIDACVIADTLNMLYLTKSQQFKTGKVMQDAGLGTPFFYILNVPCFSVHFSNETFFSVHFQIFGGLWNPPKKLY